MNHDIRTGVSLYSFQEDYYEGRRDLEGCIAARHRELDDRLPENVKDARIKPEVMRLGQLLRHAWYLERGTGTSAFTRLLTAVTI